jgi:hypothetical protein
MVWKCVRLALLAGAFASLTALSVRADDAAPQAPQTPQTPQAPAAPDHHAPLAAVPDHHTAAPCFRTVRCIEWVPEPYQCVRTCFRPVCKQEVYTAYRCECVPEVRTRCYTVHKMVPVVQHVTRTHTVCIPVCEDRTVMQPHYTCVPVTRIVRKCVDQGHWECCLVPVPPSFCERCKAKLCGKEPEQKCKEEKRWCPCPVWIECPVTVMERRCEYRPVVVKVTSYKQECRQEVVPVTTYKCVPEQCTEQCTVLVRRLVPYQATRTVTCMQPHQEVVTVTRMVPRCVEKVVPVVPCCCPPPCCRCR